MKNILKNNIYNNLKHYLNIHNWSILLEFVY